MKIKVDRPTLNVFNTITLYGLKQEFEDKLFQYFYSNSLQSLILKLARSTMRISKSVTLQLSPSESKYSPSLDNFIKLCDAILVYVFIVDKDAPDSDLAKLMRDRWKRKDESN